MSCLFSGKANATCTPIPYSFANGTIWDATQVNSNFTHLLNCANAIGGILVESPVKYATAAVLPQTPTYSNGASGVGATLTAASNSTLTVDGSVVGAGERVLVKNQAAARENGVYTLTTAGGGVPWVLTRATDWDEQADMTLGSYFFVTNGTANPASAWVSTTPNPVTVGSTAVNFNQYLKGTAYGAGTNLTLVGTTFDAGPNVLIAPSSIVTNYLSTFSGTAKQVDGGIKTFPTVFAGTPVNMAVVDVGGFPLGSEIPQSTVQGLVSKVVVPSSFTQAPWPATAISAYITNGSTTANATSVALFGFSGQTSDTGFPGVPFGLNVVTANCAALNCAVGSGYNGGGWQGVEIDVNIMKKGAATPTGAAYGLVFAGSSEVSPAQGSWAARIAPLGAGVQWLYGWWTDDAAVGTAMLIGQAAVGNSDSQPVTFKKTTGGVVNFMQSIYRTTGGYLEFIGAPVDAGGVKALNFDARNSYKSNGVNVLTSLGGANTTVYGDLGTADIVLSDTLTANSYRNTAHSFENIGGGTVFAQIKASGLQMIAYTVATLPACNGTTKGSLLRVTDALGPAYNTNVAAGGAVDIYVRCDGANWKT